MKEILALSCRERGKQGTFCGAVLGRVALLYCSLFPNAVNNEAQGRDSQLSTTACERKSSPLQREHLLWEPCSYAADGPGFSFQPRQKRFWSRMAQEAG